MVRVLCSGSSVPTSLFPCHAPNSPFQTPWQPGSSSPLHPVPGHPHLSPPSRSPSSPSPSWVRAPLKASLGLCSPFFFHLRVSSWLMAPISGCHFKSFFSYCWCEWVAVPRLPLLLLGTRLGVLSMEVSLLCHPDVPSHAHWIASSPQLRATLLPAPGEPLRSPQPPARAPLPHRWGTCPGCHIAITPHLFCTGKTKA